MDDRRRGERFAVNSEFAALEPGTLTFVSNVSETGVFVNTRHRLPVGTAVELRFTVLLDDPVIIEGPGKIVYHSDEPRGMGVAFGALSPAMVLKLADVVSHHRARAMRGEVTSAVRTRDLTPEELRDLEIGDEEPPDDGAYPEARPDDEPEYIDF